MTDRNVLKKANRQLCGSIDRSIVTIKEMQKQFEKIGWNYQALAAKNLVEVLKQSKVDAEYFIKEQEKMK